MLHTTLFINSSLFFKAFISSTYLVLLFTVLFADFTHILLIMAILFLFKFISQHAVHLALILLMNSLGFFKKKNKKKKHLVELMFLMCVLSRLPDGWKKAKPWACQALSLGGRSCTLLEQA